MDFFEIPSPIQEIHHHPGMEKGIKLFIKRDDLIHPIISGNKWRKLKYNVKRAQQQNCKILITAGGAWSNHLAATATIGKLLCIQTIGLVRGGEPSIWSETLKFCKGQGMKLVFVPRNEFDKLPESVTNRMLEMMDAYYIPLGGENELGLKGCEEIAPEIESSFDVFCLPVGTGTTLKGISRSIPNTKLIGFSALKNPYQHSPEFIEWVELNRNVELTYEYNLGGFAKSSQLLEDFIVKFYEQNKIMLEPVYTGKMMYGLFDRIEKGVFKPGSNIVCLHTGGLQGLNGYPDLHKRLFTS